MTEAYISRIATAVPPYDVHRSFLDFASALLEDDPRKLSLFRRLAERAGIDSRYSYLCPTPLGGRIGIPAHEFYVPGHFPSTAARMRAFETFAPLLAQTAIERLDLGDERARVSHLIITCCTGFSAPGLDFEIIERCRLSESLERTIVGFMGCYAAINGLKLARHIVRSESAARVLLLNLELCSLHLRETTDLNDILSSMIFSDGCAASIISAKPAGLAIDSFQAIRAPDTAGLITWSIGDAGFEMVLSGQVPSIIQNLLRESAGEILQGSPLHSIDYWAVHPGGRSILDAVEHGLYLDRGALAQSREILRHFGNMSSATVMFVLERIMKSAAPGSRGCAMSFGPGLVAETMLFNVASRLMSRRSALREAVA